MFSSWCALAIRPGALWAHLHTGEIGRIFVLEVQASGDAPLAVSSAPAPYRVLSQRMKDRYDLFGSQPRRYTCCASQNRWHIPCGGSESPEPLF
jgi:hypothetical protein